MDKISIGLAAGKVWRLLDCKGNLPIKDIEIQTGLTKDEVLVAIGWLSREDKVCFAENGNLGLTSVYDEKYY